MANIYDTCVADIRRTKTPVLFLTNRLWIGDIPLEVLLVLYCNIRRLPRDIIRAHPLSIRQKYLAILNTITHIPL